MSNSEYKTELCEYGKYQECPCTKTECVRHKKCCACVANHAQKGNLPACLRKKETEVVAGQ